MRSNLSQQNARQAGGFSLIELLVTVVVIAIAVGFIVPKLNWIRSTPAIEKPIRELASLIELARDEAALQGRNFGIRFYREGYQIFELEPDSGVWITIEDDDLLVGEAYGESFIASLVMEERDIELEEPDRETDDSDSDDPPILDDFGVPLSTASELPHIVILASGEVTPFAFALEALDEDAFVRLDGDFLGSLTLTRDRLAR